MERETKDVIRQGMPCARHPFFHTGFPPAPAPPGTPPPTHPRSRVRQAACGQPQTLPCARNPSETSRGEMRLESACARARSARIPDYTGGERGRNHRFTHAKGRRSRCKECEGRAGCALAQKMSRTPPLDNRSIWLYCCRSKSWLKTVERISVTVRSAPTVPTTSTTPVSKVCWHPDRSMMMSEPQGPSAPSGRERRAAGAADARGRARAAAG